MYVSTFVHAVLKLRPNELSFHHQLSSILWASDILWQACLTL